MAEPLEAIRALTKPIGVIRAFLDLLSGLEGAPVDVANAYREAVAAVTELEHVAAEASVKRVCVTCGRCFVLTAAEVAWYLKKVDDHGKPYVLPGRCRSCRAAHRVQMMQAPAESPR